ncbi:MAG: hypothetical protein H6729_11515 [Deltaproteobacteria bacterium]|nr:hypothetical protein [Deltaproteobacteria bacterium]
MEFLVEQLNRTPGVIGSAVLDQHGASVAYRVTPPYDAVLFTEVYREFQNISASFLAVEQGSRVTDWMGSFSGGTVLLKNVQEKTLCVIANPHANLALLSVALKVAALKLSNLPAAASPSASVPASASASGAKGSHAAPSMPARANASSGQALDARAKPAWEGVRVSTSSSVLSAQYGSVTNASAADPQVSGDLARSQVSAGGSVSMSWGSREVWANSQSPNAAGRSIMHHILRTFAKHVGPQAKFILEDELERLSYRPTTIPAPMLGTLIEAAAKRIPSKAARKKFIAEALGDL